MWAEKEVMPYEYQSGRRLFGPLSRRGDAPEGSTISHVGAVSGNGRGPFVCLRSGEMGQTGTDDRGGSALYMGLLGAAWAELDAAVRRMHPTGGVRAAGRFRIRRGAGGAARLLAWLGRLPSAGEAVEVRLRVEARGEVECWRRAFGAVSLVSLQGPGRGGLLVERIGLLVLGFRLEVEDRALMYRPAGCALRIGRLSLPLPAAVAPRVAAREAAAADGAGVEIAVEVRVPRVGLVLAYDGRIRVEREPR
jgi:hypothetical protein